jgi:hypothetical protein
MTPIQKHPTHCQWLQKRRRPIPLYAVERARLRARHWKQWPTAEIEGQP